MNTIHTSQSIRKKDEHTAANDDNLTMASVYLLSLINRTIAVEGAFTMTGAEISQKWGKFSIRTAQRSLNELEANGYIKTKVSGDMFNQVREVETLEESDKKVVKPHVKEKSLEKRKKIEMFDKFWNKYNVKKGRKKAEDKFLKLSMSDCEKCLKAVDSYVIATPEIKFRKHVTTWLNGEHWNDEITIGSVVGAYNHNAQKQREQRAAELDRDSLLQKEKIERLRQRFEKFGWQKPFANHKDLEEKRRIESNGYTADIEAIITKRLKREGKQYKK